jgi:hypothetical protein
MLIRHFKKKRIIPLILFSGIGLLFYVITAFSQTALSGFNLEIKNLAEKSRGEVIAQFEDLLANKSLTINYLTLFISRLPIPILKNIKPNMTL